MKSAKKVLLFLLLTCSNYLIAQLEVDLQVARLQGATDLLVIDLPLEPSSSFSIGGDLLFGSNKLVPMVGVFYQQIKYNDGFHVGSQVILPLGLAYRLRAPHTSFNLVLNANIAPVLKLEEIVELASIPEENDLLFQGRIGLALYLDFITVHYDRWIPFSNRWEGLDEKVSFQTLGLGVRF
ncbi:MAG: hypothetical protein AAFU67_07020 [Bacteroidota bacterium]